MKSGNFTLACARFEESQQAEAALGTLLNLALCEEARGRLVRAHGLFEELLTKAPTEDPRRELIGAHLPELARRIPSLTLVTSGCEKFDCKLLIDGEPITADRAGTPIEVDPGEHRVVLVAAGHPDRPITVTLVEGESVVRTIELAEVSGTPPERPRESERARVSHPDTPAGTAGRDRTLAYVLGATGAAFVVASVVTGLVALSEWHTVQRDCTGSTCRSNEGIAASARGRTLATTSTVTFAVGAVAIGCGAVLYFSGGANTRSSSQQATPSFAIGLSHRF
jgi:hypothetical protein